VLSEIHLVTQWSGVLGLGACVAQQRLENNLREGKQTQGSLEGLRGEKSLQHPRR